VGTATRESLWLCLEWSPWGGFSINFNDKVARLTYFQGGAIYAATKVEECWLKLGAYLCHTPAPDYTATV